MKELTKQSQSHVKDNNLRLILNTIIREQPLSRADIVRSTEISKPTVSALTDELIDRGIVSEIGRGHSAGGRKPMLLQFNSMLKVFVAFEMGRVGYRIALSDLKGSILGKKNDEYPSQCGLPKRLDMLKQGILSLMGELSIDMQDILKIICIAPGIYVEKDREMKWYPGDSSDEAPDMKAYLQGIFGQEVIFDHSTKLSLFGEKMEGKAHGYADVLYIDFAYGLGCSFMINGNVYFGSSNAAGEIGYFYSSLDEFKSYRITPYELGALELNMSGFSLRQKAIESMKAQSPGLIRDLVKGDANRITAKILFQAAMEGDGTANTILKESFSYFNMALSNAINMLTPELVILGGGFSNAGQFLLQLIEDEIADKVLMMPKLLISDLKNDASIIGGIHYLIQRTDFLNEL
jgi:glucokinase